MSSETTDFTEKENIRCWNSTLQGMFQWTLRFNISINDTGKTKHAKEVVGVRAEKREDFVQKISYCWVTLKHVVIQNGMKVCNMRWK